jgi:NTP pyrophosphatase (non-canonical NTP hydrolase)
VSRVDQLERVATRAIQNTYGKIKDDAARFWIQKGIEGMRYAVAIEQDTVPLQDVAAERTRQDAKWGQQDHDIGIWLGILGEEFGEVAKEIAESSARPLDVAHLREELIQTAAVAVAWVEAIDRAS